MAVDVQSGSIFLTWSLHEQPDEEKKVQLNHRHRHAAPVDRRRRRTRTLPIHVNSPGENKDIQPSANALTRHVSLSVTPEEEGNPDANQRKIPVARSPSQSQLDPFDSLCVSTLSEPAQKMLKFGRRRDLLCEAESSNYQSSNVQVTAMFDQWPHFALSSQKNDVEEWRSALMKHAVEAPVLLQGLIYSATSYFSFFGTRNASLEILRLQSYHDTIQNVQVMILKTDQSSETLLLAIAVIAMFGAPDQFQGKKLLNHSHKLAQDNEFYSRANTETSHLHALVALTKQRGGLSSISLTNLAGLIFMLDVLDSFSNLRKPSFPNFLSHEDYLDHLKFGQDLRRQRRPELDEVEDGFAILRGYKPAQGLLKVVAHARALMDSHDAYVENARCGVDFLKLIIARRLIQHEALSTKSEGTLIYRVCRLGLLMFLCESLEPFPQIRAYHSFSSRQMMLLIDECDKLGYWEFYPDLLLWATILGGYTARTSSLQWWFAEQLRSSRIPTLRDRWPDARRHVKLREKNGHQSASPVNSVRFTSTDHPPPPRKASRSQTMLPTPSTSHAPYDLIYEPAEDSFLFLDTLSSASETSWLQTHFSQASSNPARIPLLVEIGPGSGVIIAFLTANAGTIFGTQVLSLSVDVNPHAALATSTTVRRALEDVEHAARTSGPEPLAGQQSVGTSVYLSSALGDLTSPLQSGEVDVLVFNPPYVPTEAAPTLPPISPTTTKPTFEESSLLLELSYGGGVDGMEVTNRLLAQIPNVLSAKGVAYVLFCRGNKPEEVKRGIRDWAGSADGRCKWQAETVGTSGKKAGWEKLEIVRIWREWT
ncbi:S-adenosylmethionine-dependent methyltransferase [Cladophialophora chaetospira]|uniref:S-adenosylmethionine-dependent methyltransferase n=1 Tax=Cladophialophora chaetospira TaxID=386627 RepID=A0AA38X7S0_9EURO|nr:S-adenosylmethionine-dependent methyltransferase [Cladophialophora chaetospira]